jgi:hypothetical protein
LRLLQEKRARAGFELKARLPIYPEFIHQGEKYLPRQLIHSVERLCGSDGLVKDNGPLQHLPILHHSITPSLPGLSR